MATLNELYDILHSDNRSHAIKVRDAMVWVADAIREADGAEAGNKVQRKSKSGSKEAAKNVVRKDSASNDSGDAGPVVL